MIYLDNNASTPLDPDVWRAMAAAATVHGNASSVHAEGQKARRTVEESRESIARLLGARPDEVFLTSGGTESNAMAIFGAAAGRSGRVVISGAEHPSVREAAARLAASGCEVVTVAPERSGALDPGRVLEAVTPGTLLVSVMAANNEYGGLYPVPAIAAEVRRRGALFHTDAVQMAGRLPLDAAAWDVDMLSASAHKMHGPKGAGALYVRRGVRLAPHTPGGGQERRQRAGTENTLAIVGFGAAARLARERLSTDPAEVGRLRDRLERGILEKIPGTRAIGSDAPRVPNTSALLFEGVSGEALLVRLDLEGVAVSVGSACSSGTLAPSPALLSLGLSREEARSVVRFSLSRMTREEEIRRVLELLPEAVGAARGAAALAGARDGS
ncbi:MAG: cysteine desulfurase family protein [Thermoanaerobaculia bacterium]